MLEWSFYSSFVFLVEGLGMFLLREDVYGVLFVFLFLTSLLYRWYPNTITLISDKLAIMYVVLYGTNCLWENIENNDISAERLYVIVFTFLVVLYLYYGGYWMKRYCFDPEHGELWHAYVHMISCVGHTMIILLKRTYGSL